MEVFFFSAALFVSVRRCLFLIWLKAVVVSRSVKVGTVDGTATVEPRNEAAVWVAEGKGAAMKLILCLTCGWDACRRCRDKTLSQGVPCTRTAG